MDRPSKKLEIQSKTCAGPNQVVVNWKTALAAKLVILPIFNIPVIVQ